MPHRRDHRRRRVNVVAGAGERAAGLREGPAVEPQPPSRQRTGIVGAPGELLELGGYAPEVAAREEHVDPPRPGCHLDACVPLTTADREHAFGEVGAVVGAVRPAADQRPSAQGGHGRHRIRSVTGQDQRLAASDVRLEQLVDVHAGLGQPGQQPGTQRRRQPVASGERLPAALPGGTLPVQRQHARENQRGLGEQMGSVGVTRPGGDGLGGGPGFCQVAGPLQSGRTVEHEAYEV